MSMKQGEERSAPMVSKDREYRSFDFNVDPTNRIVGRAVVFDTPTVIMEFDGVQYFEKIARDAFTDAKMTDVVLVVNHTGTPAARTKNGTLDLEVRNDGLWVSADPSKSSIGEAVMQDVRSGNLDKMSFAFTIAKQSFDKKSRTLTIERIDRLYDVSIVTFPAYEDTSVSARDGVPGINQLSVESRELIEAEAKTERAAEATRRDDVRKRIAIMAMLGSEDSARSQRKEGASE